MTNLLPSTPEKLEVTTTLALGWALLSRQVMGLCLDSDLWPAAFPCVL